MSNPNAVNRDQYTYATGRIRALELRLFDTARYARLYDARSLEDISRVLAESGYPQLTDPEAALAREYVLVYELFAELVPDKAYAEALLLHHDFHNIKVILKYLSPWWSSDKDTAVEGESLKTGLSVETATEKKATLDLPDLDEASGADKQHDILKLRHLFLLPSVIDPALLYQAISERQPDLIPAWAYEAAVTAAGAYQSSYDVSEIDIVLDKLAWREAREKADETGDPVLKAWQEMRIDLLNLAILLRSKKLHEGPENLKRTVLAAGTLKRDRLIDLEGLTYQEIATWLRETPYASLADICEHYQDKGSASRFSLAADNFLVAYSRKAKWVLSGPEVPLAYLLARETEIKNIRIAIACLKNGIPMHQARDLARDRYLEWR